MQPYLFPYIGYFQLMKAVEKFVVYDDVSFINRGWINRNNLLINGKASLFTVPLTGASQNRLIKDIPLAEDAKWPEKLMKTIEVNYRRAPFFGPVQQLLTGILAQRGVYINELIVASLKAINAYLGIGTTLVESSVVYGNDHLKAQDRILDICRQEGCTTYVNPIGGTALYDKDRFGAAGIALKFIKSKPIAYRQFSGPFVPWLSIIDVLMFNPAEEVNHLLNEYELL
jgi:hypothetical protein